MADSESSTAVRKGQCESFLSRNEFEKGYRAMFFDPAFRDKDTEINQPLQIAWDAYKGARKSPITPKAGAEFAPPDYDLSVEWIATREQPIAGKSENVVVTIAAYPQCRGTGKTISEALKAARQEWNFLHDCRAAWAVETLLDRTASDRRQP
jgi:hypothetical protein